MKRIVLISCVSRKGTIKSKARDLYKGPLFNNSLCVAKKLQVDEKSIFILSAKHYLVGLDDIISPYDMTLKKMSNSEKINWGKMVIYELKKVSNIDTDEYIILAGRDYRNPISEIKNLKDFLGSRNYGKRTSFLKSLCVDKNSDISM